MRDKEPNSTLHSVKTERFFNPISIIIFKKKGYYTASLQCSQMPNIHSIIKKPGYSKLTKLFKYQLTRGISFLAIITHSRRRLAASCSGVSFFTLTLAALPAADATP
jgi:hypothetical protein